MSDAEKLAQVRELHKPDTTTWLYVACTVCVDGLSYEWEPTAWPCATALVVYDAEEIARLTGKNAT